MIQQLSNDDLGRNTISIILLLVLFGICGATHAYAKEPKITKSEQETGQVLAVKAGQIIDQQYEEELLKKLPLNPTQIRDFRKRLETTTRAIRPKAPQKIITETRKLNLEPGQKAPKIILNPHFVTGLSFFDISGEPWPITSATVGNPEWFSAVRPEKLEPGNFLTISPMATFATSNIIITLQGWNLPILINLETSDVKKLKNSDGNIAFMADKRGPFAKTPMIVSPMESPITDELLGFLDAVPPEKAMLLKNISAKEGVDLWQYKEKFYLRTVHHLVWPAWDGTVRGGNGITLYTLPIVNSLIISENGKKTTLKVN